MSEFQTGLVVIGALIVAGVFGFNKWQERHARRAADEAFKSRHPDILMGAEEPVSSTRPNVGEERLEPRIAASQAGIVEMASIASAELQLVVDCCPPGTIERMPEPATVALLGIGVRQVRLAPFEPSAAYKLLMLLENDRLLRSRPSTA